MAVEERETGERRRWDGQTTGKRRVPNNDQQRDSRVACQCLAQDSESFPPLCVYGSGFHLELRKVIGKAFGKGRK